jgi:hypothetical protein
MLDLILGLAFGALLLRLAARMERPRPIPIATANRRPQGRRP